MALNHFQITSEKLLQIIDSYKYTLTIFGHETVPKFESVRAFHDRIDSIMLLMARNCYNLTTLVSIFQRNFSQIL